MKNTPGFTRYVNPSCLFQWYKIIRWETEYTHLISIPLKTTRKINAKKEKWLPEKA